jgi:D-alanyl-D-alanine carboxypeptidase
VAPTFRLPFAMIVMAALSSAVGAGTARAADKDALQACIAGEGAGTDFSGVVSVLRGNGTVSHAQGLMGGPGSGAIGPDAQFNLGSAGKMFTAVAVAQLLDERKIGLDDPIGRHVDGLTPEAAAVTIRQLLTHSGGLGNFFVPENLPALAAARSLSDLKPLLSGDRPAFQPGSRFAYSNSGFLLLGLMIERVSGLSYGDYLQTKIFGPSGMTSSSLVPGTPSTRAIGMTRMPDMPPPPPGAPLPPAGAMPPPPPGGPGGPPPGLTAGPLRPAAEAALMGNSAGGSYSSAPDMQRFFTALLGGKLTSQASRDLLLSPQIVVAPARDGMPARTYGLGFGVGTSNGQRWIGHNGGAPGVNVETMAFPDDGTVVIVMANRDPPVAGLLARKVRTMVLDGQTCRAPAAGSSATGASSQTSTTP